VVREPRQFPVNIKGIEQELCTYLIENITDELADRSDQVRVKSVKRVTIDSFSITVERIVVALLFIPRSLSAASCPYIVALGESKPDCFAAGKHFTGDLSPQS
jgi:hypothetical protein